MGLQNDIWLGAKLDMAPVSSLHGVGPHVLGSRGITLWRRLGGFPHLSLTRKGPSGQHLGVIRSSGGEAGEGDSLSIMFGPSEFPEDEDRWGRSRAGLQHAIQRVKTTRRKTGYIYSTFEYLRSGQGLWPGAPLVDVIGVRLEIIRKGDSPFLGRLLI